ncbi:Cupin 2 conserved barrel domain protein [Pirellula staleyi DSM 6068]|uniref:Cupin 2 conserved barrel domain protein n=1 Tax=Pirellula staleyi (strain ATCC 27377 / DSM 6068 / ICPB 4128) TaxID=530564 RepID=D2QYM4_PIRSD|nr:cupin domain-containing protein [Pirellula staleyi]ADB18183.1 Cupin 2 conserved barrel domain protein [Pirellula staleyi DSM 6068]
MTHPATVRTTDEGKTFAIVGDIYRFLVTGDETGGAYAMWEAVVGPGGGPPPHIHSREEESFYILEGEITFTIGDQTVVATPGMFANVSRGTAHSFRNQTEKPARMIISVAPAGLEKMFISIGTPCLITDPVPPITPADIERVIAAAPQYGVTLLLPPH